MGGTIFPIMIRQLLPKIGYVLFLPSRFFLVHFLLLA